jgi:hypothetical protein
MTNTSVGSNYTDYTGVTTKFIELIQGSNNKIVIDKKLQETIKELQYGSISTETDTSISTKESLLTDQTVILLRALHLQYLQMHSSVW